MRALKSIISYSQFETNDLEIIISDDSSDNKSKEVAERTLKDWKGLWKYIHNKPALGMADNWNQSIQIASGQYVLILHDDDYLVEHGVENLLKIIKEVQAKKNVMLFGVSVVNTRGRVMKKQHFIERIYLEPKEAIKRLMSNSSFIRFPGIVIKRNCFENVGYFRPDIGGVADLDMWIRLLGNYGLLCIPLETSAYTVHSSALTMEMFNKGVIQQLLERFSEVEKLNLLSEKEVKKCKAYFFNQFILAGTFRQIRRLNLNETNHIMYLFKLPEIQELEISLKWITPRSLFIFLFFIYNQIKAKN
jgi:glycosyltransferase involved in cell wall biosynthesis